MLGIIPYGGLRLFCWFEVYIELSRIAVMIMRDR